MARFGLICLSVIACASPSNQSRPVSAEQPAAETVATSRIVRVFHTSDEHGWLDGRFSRSKQTRYGGTELLSRYLQRMGFDRQRDLLVSGGDMWTGPAISTLLEGKPMVEVFNHLGYAATAVGNHEFDFGPEALKKNMADSQFKYLAGNIVSSDRAVRRFEPTAVFQRAGLKVGVIGLAHIDTPKVTRGDHVAGLEFKPYLPLVLDLASQLKVQQQVDVSIVLIHDDVRVFEPQLVALHKAGVRALLGGHVHRPFHKVNGSMALCVPQDKLKEICEVVIDLDADTVRVDRVKITSPDKEIRDPGLKAILDKAKADSDERGKEVLGQLTGPLKDEGNSEDHGLGQLVGQSWLAADAVARVAVTNRGGLRANLDAGPVTVSDIIGVMPFTNSIVRVHLTAEELTEVLKHPQSLVTGASIAPKGGNVLVQGQPLPAGQRVPVIINDFMFFGGDGYRFTKYDSAPVMLDIPWRRPIYSYIRRVKTTGPNELKRAWAKSLKP